MDAKEKVLSTMKEAGQPINAGRIADSAVSTEKINFRNIRLHIDVELSRNTYYHYKM